MSAEFNFVDVSKIKDVSACCLNKTKTESFIFLVIECIVLDFVYKDFLHAEKCRFFMLY